MRDSLCEAKAEDVETDVYALKDDEEGYFEDIFYRCRHEELKETIDRLRQDFSRKILLPSHHLHKKQPPALDFGQEGSEMHPRTYEKNDGPI